MLRRRFLQSLVVTVVASACGDEDESPGEGAPGPLVTSAPEQSHKFFPQGVASGDPRPSSVILWTRLEVVANGVPATGATISYVIAKDEALAQVVARGEVKTSNEQDFTVRLKVEQLEADTVYFYRFHVSGVTTQVGRTRTAPAPDADRPVTFAFASCQDFIGRHYHAWQALLDEGQELDFVLFLGDYIYETTGDPSFQSPTPDREVKLPEGLLLGEEGNVAALTLADYRTLYRTYRGDPVLREVHRRYPFVLLWDDHEFANDCWQDHATDFNESKGDEKSTARRTAANQAWAEFQPVDVERAAGAEFPKDLTIYRSLSYGKHLDLFVTDQRLYRSDHVVPEGPSDDAVGKFSKNTGLGSRNFVLKSGFDPREAAAKPTMLGAEQKAWFLESVKGSKSTWKLWANEVQLWQMILDLSSFETLPEEFRGKFYYTCDQWDGYRSERAESLGALAGVGNLVACTGDIHGFYAAELHTDFDAPGAVPVGVEYVVAGVSSQSLREITRGAVEGNAVLKGLGLLDLVPQLDEVFLQANPYLKHADSAANGVALASVSAGAFRVTFLRTGDPTKKEDTGVKERKVFQTLAGAATIVAG
jgi:alkaline phosphatase D